MIEPNKIYNEDCLQFMKKIPDDYVNYCITSPPYNLNLRIHMGEYKKRSINEKTKYNGEYMDAMLMDDYFEWQKNVIQEMLRITSGIVFYNIQMLTGNKLALMKLMGHFANKIKEIIIWDKKHSEPAISDNVMCSEFEFIIIFDKTNAIARQFDVMNAKKGSIKNIFRIGKNSDNEIPDAHNAAFPRELPYKLIELFTNEGDLICDPFMGTGTTAKVCMELKRNFIGSEISPHFYGLCSKIIQIKKSTPQLF